MRAEVDGLGPVLFCHGSPRSDTEIITALSPPERLAPMLDGVAEDVVVCGHTHHQFDRAECGKRVLNAGSVGMPYEDERGGVLALARAGRRAAAHGLRHRGGGRADARLRPARPRRGDAAREPARARFGAAFVARHFEQRATR